MERGRCTSLADCFVLSNLLSGKECLGYLSLVKYEISCPSPSSVSRASEEAYFSSKVLRIDRKPLDGFNPFFQVQCPEWSVLENAPAIAA